jgi:hypothetical protein
MDGDRAQDHERYIRLDRLGEQLGLMVRRQVRFRFVQCLHGQRRSEHGADANGPKRPLKTASRNVLISGIQRYVAIMMGNRRRSKMRMTITMSRQTLSVNSSFSKEPTKMKTMQRKSVEL